MSTQTRPTSTARVVLLGEGEYEVPVATDKPVTLGELLGGLGISDRDGQLYLDGVAATFRDRGAARQSRRAVAASVRRLIGATIRGSRGGGRIRSGSPRRSEGPHSGAVGCRAR